MAKLFYKVLGWLFAVAAAGNIASAIASDGDHIGILVTTAGIFSALSWFFFRRARMTNETGNSDTDAIQRLTQEAEAWLDAAYRRGRFEQYRPERAILGKTEFAVLCGTTSMRELATERRNAGVGTRIKVGGLPIYLGGSRGISHQVLKEVAEGELVVTNKRLMFIGRDRQIVIPWAKLAGIEAFMDSILVADSGKAKPVMFPVPNGLLWAMAIRKLTELDLNDNNLPVTAVSAPVSQ